MPASAPYQRGDFGLPCTINSVRYVLTLFHIAVIEWCYPGSHPVAAAILYVTAFFPCGDFCPAGVTYRTSMLPFAVFGDRSLLLLLDRRSQPSFPWRNIRATVFTL